MYMYQQNVLQRKVNKALFYHTKSAWPFQLRINKPIFWKRPQSLVDYLDKNFTNKLTLQMKELMSCTESYGAINLFKM